MKLTKRLIILSGLLIISISISFAAVVTAEKASQVARNFYTEKRMAAGPGVPFSLHAERIIPITDNSTTLLYVVCFDDAGGFVLVAGDDRVQPVLGYSFNGRYGSTELPAAFTDLLNHYQSQIQGAIQRNAPGTESISTAWKTYADAINFQPKPVKAQVLPLLSTTWDQGCYYNDSVPPDINSWSCGHVPTGCVATSIAQIIKYHAYPATGSGKHTYNHPIYGSLTADYGNTTYDFAAMPDNLSGPNTALAQLMFHCGVGVDMGYGPYESGAASSNAALALVHYFQYADSTRLVHKVNYTTAAWNNLIRHEIDQLRPVYYTGFGPGIGHAFVCDGYQTSTFFHFNWGWSGFYNGYYYLDNLDPGGNTFNDYQEAIIGIKPGNQAACSPKALTAEQGDINDGSYASDYLNNQSCSWLIQPSANAAYISLEFITFSTEAGNDLVKVYDGTSNTAPLLGTYSGSLIPLPIATTTGAVFLEFLTNSNLSQSGWSARYAIHYCFPADTMTAGSGTFGDGSGSVNYKDMTDCYWLIQPALPGIIALTFNSFATEQDYDMVTVYDGPDTQAPVIGQFSGNAIPPVLYSVGNSMLVHFFADQGVNEGGWDAVYSTSVGIGGLDTPGAIAVYPNPASKSFRLLMADKKMTLIKLCLNDLSGRTVRDYPVTAGHDLNSSALSLDGIASGIYSLVFESNEGRFVKKLVVE